MKPSEQIKAVEHKFGKERPVFGTDADILSRKLHELVVCIDELHAARLSDTHAAAGLIADLKAELGKRDARIAELAEELKATAALNRTEIEELKTAANQATQGKLELLERVYDLEQRNAPGLPVGKADGAL